MCEGDLNVTHMNAAAMTASFLLIQQDLKYVSMGKLALRKLSVYVVVKGKCYLKFQLTITITVDLSVDNNNFPTPVS